MGERDFSVENSSHSSASFFRKIREKLTIPNETQLEILHRNMTLLKANMSGVDAIVKHIQGSSGQLNESVDERVNVVNPHPFEYLINCPDMCKRINGELFVIAYIHSAVDHYKRRMIIRQTWGNSAYYDVNIRLVFVMGAKVSDGSNSEIQQALYFEAEQYADIVQENFDDTYRNLTYKGIAALKWISNYCSHAKFVVKTDDDIFVNSFALLKRLSRLVRQEKTSGFLMCLVWKNMVVMRQGKWKVDESEWKDSTYPTYCSGSAFILSMDVALKLYKISYQVPFFWVDDFYITGLLPLKLGNVTHIQISSSYVLNGKMLEEKFTSPQWFQYLFSHVHNLNSIQTFWRKVVDLASGKAMPTIKFALPGQLPKVEHKIDP